MSEFTNWKPVYKFLHWAVALCIALDILWLEDSPHEWVGYLALAFVATRVVLEYFFKSPKYANVIAKVVYFFIWTAVAALALTGWMLGLDQYWGDENLTALHEGISNALVVAILIHFAGLLRNAFYHRKNAWKGMLP